MILFEETAMKKLKASTEKKTRRLRIGLVGASGTGKSSIARGVAEKLGISFVESKSITKSILDRDEYDYASGIQVERFLADSSRQNEILKKTIESQSDVGPFIADRTVIDLAAYAVIELHDEDSALLRKIFYACKKHASVYTHIFLCPWKDAPISDNHQRTLNPWYQFLIHALDEGIMDDWGIKSVVLKSEGTDKRVAEIVAVITKSKASSR
jgi:adenylylsulfate kinase-like enzyme